MKNHDTKQKTTHRYYKNNLVDHSNQTILISNTVLPKNGYLRVDKLKVKIFLTY